VKGARKNRDGFNHGESQADLRRGYRRLHVKIAGKFGRGEKGLLVLERKGEKKRTFG